MALANPNPAATAAAIAMVLYMIFPFAFVLLRTKIRVQAIGWTERLGGSPSVQKNICALEIRTFAGDQSHLGALLQATPIPLNGRFDEEKSLSKKTSS
jgi:hypothetical protein